MGRFLTGFEAFGDAAYEHEGYAAQVLDDGSLSAAYSAETMPRMVGRVVAACDCGWTGTTRYPTTDPFDEAAEELALAEWERDHARPALEGLRAEAWDRLRTVVRRLAESHAMTTRTRFSALTSGQQREVLDRTLAGLDRALGLTHQLRNSGAADDGA